MNKDYLWCAKEIISFLPSDWDKVIFSLLVRDCKLNGSKALSKEFKCKCISKSIGNVIDLVKYYENDYEIQDKMLDLTDFWYEQYKLNRENSNLIIFKLYKNGDYEIRNLKIDNNIDNKIIDNIVVDNLKS